MEFHCLGHDDCIVHGVLTSNNLFDGTITTPTESYYIEPASRYSSELTDNGIHTIVYKTSDVHMLPHQNEKPSKNEPTQHYCASQRLHEKLMNRKNKDLTEAPNLDLANQNIITEHVSNEKYLSRNKRWVVDEVITIFISYDFHCFALCHFDINPRCLT